MRRISYLILIAVLFLTACKKEIKKEEIVEEVKPVSVFAQQMTLRDFPEYIKISGKLEGAVDIVIISEVSGKVLKLNKKLGDWVEKDEEIGEIDSEIIKLQLDQAKAAVLSAEASYLTATSNLQTSESLYSNKTISKAEYDSAITSEKGVKAQLEGAIAQKKQIEQMLESARITAPASGFISELPITIGNMVVQGTVLSRIVDSKNLKVKTAVGETVVKSLKKGQKVTLLSKSEKKELSGIVSGFGVAPSNGSVNYPIEIDVKNTANLFAGEIVEIQILKKMHRNVFVVQQESIIKEFDHTFVYIINNDNTLERKVIRILNTIENKHIIDGINEGEKIVKTGTENVENGTLIKIRKEFKE